MKKPKISLSKESIVDFFLHHGEKLVVGLFAALACTLVWGGIDAVRTKTAKREQAPGVITEHAGRTMKHIADSKTPPPETVKRQSLTKLVEPWRAPPIAASASTALINRPLSEEKVKRTKPAILPLEDLRVRAGHIVLAAADAKLGGMAGMMTQSAGPRGSSDDGSDGKKGDKDGKKKGQKKGAEGSDTVPVIPGGRPGKMMGGPSMGDGGGMAGMMARQAPPLKPGKIVPYCLVTGLIPLTAQYQDYLHRFANAGYQDPSRDNPVWTEFMVERAEVAAGKAADADLKWKKIDLAQAVKNANKEWVATQPESLPYDVVLDAMQQASAEQGGSVLAYCGPLPQLADDPWGFESLHPWFIEQLRKRFSAEEALQAQMAAEAQEGGRNVIGGGAPSMGGGPSGGAMGMMRAQMGGPGGAGPPMGGPGGGPPGGGPGGGSTMSRPPMGGSQSMGRSMAPPGMGPGMMSSGGPSGPGGRRPPMMGGGDGGTPAFGGDGGLLGQTAGAAGQGAEGELQRPLEYRLFRFVDMSVESGKTYRYRVRISVFNPNYDMPAQYLADAALAKDLKLASETSKPSPLAHISEPTSLLARTLRKGEGKKSKTGYEVLLLAEDPETGNYALRSIAAELGGLANIDKRLAKGPDAKARGEDVITDSVLIDARGRQDDRDDKDKKASALPSEPLELLFLRADGSFSLASAADSQESVDRYAQTLASPDDGKKDKDKDGSGSQLFPGGGLFGPPGGGPPGAGTPPGSPPGGTPGGARSSPPGAGR